MTKEMQDKYKRLNQRMDELKWLQDKIFKLNFYLTETPPGDIKQRELYERQLNGMEVYKESLEERMRLGIY